MRRTNWAAALAIALLANLAVAQAQKDNEGFVALFNGRDFSGWVITAGPADAAKAWSVKEGAIDVSGKQPGSWLRSEKIYKDFVLRLEYKIAQRENSGVFLRSLEKGNPAYSGMEIQIYGDDPWRAPGVHSNGALYGAVPPTCSPARNGEWNRLEIELRGMHLAERQNGIEVMDVRLDDPEWNHRITEANKAAAAAYKAAQPRLPARLLGKKPDPSVKKRAPMPLLTERVREGYIGLQNHGSPVRFRNIRIKTL
jgi:hypothetical protein